MPKIAIFLAAILMVAVFQACCWALSVRAQSRRR